MALTSCGPAGSTTAASNNPSNARTTIEPAPGLHIYAFATASFGGQGAILYQEGPTDSFPNRPKVTTKLQRLALSGDADGPPVEMGQSFRGEVAIATDGNRYVTCWGGGPALPSDPIQCASIPFAGGGPELALAVDGRYPVVRHADGAWTLAYQVASRVVLQRIDGAAQPIGLAKALEVGVERMPTLLATRGDALLLVAGLDRANAHWFDSRLEPLAPPIDLGVPFWGSGSVAIAATGMTAAIVLAKPYGATLFEIDRASVQSRSERGGPDADKRGAIVDLSADEGSILQVGRNSSRDRYVRRPLPGVVGADSTPFSTVELGGRLQPYAVHLIVHDDRERLVLDPVDVL